MFTACALVAFLIISSGGASALAAVMSSPTTACDAFDSLDLAVHAGNQIDNRLSEALPSNSLPLFSSRDFSLTDIPWTVNPDSWTKKGTPLDFTGVAGYISVGYNTANRLGTLISPRHFIAASHYHPAKDEKLAFIDKDGNRIERTVVGGQSIGSTDVFVGVLDSDLPDSIAYYPIMASSTLQSLIKKFNVGSLDVPIVAFDQEAKALVRSLSGISNTYISQTAYTEGSRKEFSEDVISGDSGNPGLMIIDNQPVLLSAHHTAVAANSSGPNYGNYINEINSIMVTFGGGYQVTEYNPTCFTEYTLNNLPVFKSYPQKVILHTDDTPPLTLGTYSATDIDQDQAISYSLLSLTVDSVPTSDFASYFSIDATTGELSLITPLDPALVGKDIKLAVKAEDNGLYSGIARATSTIDFRNALNQTKKIILDPDFSRPTINLSNFLDISFDEDGKMVAVGSFSTVNGKTQNGITRLNADGSNDADFQSVIGSGLGGMGTTLFIDSDGKMVVGGTFLTFNGSITGRLTRLNNDGTLDADFLAKSGTGISAFRVTKAIDVNGKILTTGLGLTSYDGISVGRMVMINNDGSLDTDFHNNFGAINGAGNTLLLDGDHIYVGGSFIGYIYPDGTATTSNRIARFSVNGKFDEEFAQAIGTGFDNQVRSIAIRPDGKIVVVGDFHKFNNVDVNYIALLNPDGTLDSEFALNVAKVDNNLFSMLIEPDNKIIIGGNPFKINSTTFLGGIARLNADGSLDEEFHNALGDGMDGGVTRLLRREDEAIVAVGNLISYNGTALNNSIAVLVPLEDKKEEPVPTPDTNTSSGGGGGGGGDGSGGGSSGSSSGTVAGASIAVLEPQSAPAPSAPVPQIFSPKRNLYAGVSGEDVRALQKYLNGKGFIVSLSGAGSVGNETAYFGGKTKAALAKFQKSAGIFPSVGFLGRLTRAHILSHQILLYSANAL